MTFVINFQMLPWLNENKKAPVRVLQFFYFQLFIKRAMASISLEDIGKETANIIAICSKQVDKNA